LRRRTAASLLAPGPPRPSRAFLLGDHDARRLAINGAAHLARQKLAIIADAGHFDDANRRQAPRVGVMAAGFFGVCSLRGARHLEIP